MSDTPRTWVLLGGRTGDNNQALALAETLSWPFEVKQLAYNQLQSLSVWLPPTLASLTAQAKSRLTPPWPDLVIAIGRRSVPAARWIKQQSGGSAKLVRIGHPRIDPALFDLVITTRQYPVPPGDNVLLLPVAMGRSTEPPSPTPDEQALLDGVDANFDLFAVGGPTKYWRMPDQSLLAAIEATEGPIVVATSRRTPESLVTSLRILLADRPISALVDGPSPRFPLLLDRAGRIFVTGDSVSMISEAVLTGKPVAIIPIELDDKGQRKLGAVPKERGPDARRRDLRRFWNHLIEEGMAGTLADGPRAAANIPDPNAMAADAVRRLLGDRC